MSSSSSTTTTKSAASAAQPLDYISKTGTIYGSVCGRCGRPGNMLPQCARCNCIHYCSRECQSLHWPTIHRHECRQLAASCGLSPPVRLVVWLPSLIDDGFRINMLTLALESIRQQICQPDAIVLALHIDPAMRHVQRAQEPLDQLANTLRAMAAQLPGRFYVLATGYARTRLLQQQQQSAGAAEFTTTILSAAARRIADAVHSAFDDGGDSATTIVNPAQLLPRLVHATQLIFPAPAAAAAATATAERLLINVAGDGDIWHPRRVLHHRGAIGNFWLGRFNNTDAAAAAAADDLPLIQCVQSTSYLALNRNPDDDNDDDDDNEKTEGRRSDEQKQKQKQKQSDVDREKLKARAIVQQQPVHVLETSLTSASDVHIALAEGLVSSIELVRARPISSSSSSSSSNDDVGEGGGVDRIADAMRKLNASSAAAAVAADDVMQFEYAVSAASRIPLATLWLPLSNIAGLLLSLPASILQSSMDSVAAALISVVANIDGHGNGCECLRCAKRACRIMVQPPTPQSWHLYVRSRDLVHQDSIDTRHAAAVVKHSITADRAVTAFRQMRADFEASRSATPNSKTPPPPLEDDERFDADGAPPSESRFLKMAEQLTLRAYFGRYPLIVDMDAAAAAESDAVDDKQQQQQQQQRRREVESGPELVGMSMCAWLDLHFPRHGAQWWRRSAAYSQWLFQYVTLRYAQLDKEWVPLQHRRPPAAAKHAAAAAAAASSWWDSDIIHLGERPMYPTGIVDE